jgi:hypothetical protein
MNKAFQAIVFFIKIIYPVVMQNDDMIKEAVFYPFFIFIFPEIIFEKKAKRAIFFTILNKSKRSTFEQNL